MKTKSIPSFLFHISTFTGKFFTSMPVAPLLSSPDSLFILQIWPLAPTRRSGRVDINYVTPSSPCHASHYPGQCDVWRWEGPGLTRSVDGVSTRRPHARSRSRYLYRVSPARTLVQWRRRCHQLRSKEIFIVCCEVLHYRIPIQIQPIIEIKPHLKTDIIWYDTRTMDLGWPPRILKTKRHCQAVLRSEGQNST